MVGAAPVPETPVELKYGVDVGIVAVHSVVVGRDAVFPYVLWEVGTSAPQGMMTVDVVGVGRSHNLVFLFAFVSEGVSLGLPQLVFLVEQPFHGNFGMVDGPSPAVERFRGDGPVRCDSFARPCLMLRGWSFDGGD